MKIPDTKEEWNEIIHNTYERWNFPNAFAAADGKHVGILCPNNSGSEFYNYKGFFSIVLLAFVDYNYRFMVAEVGCQGRISDGGVYRNSNMFKALTQSTLHIPEPRPLPKSSDPFWAHSESDQCIPMVFVADDAFPLSDICMKPYSQRKLTEEMRIFNYRLSRFRRISENAFGIWVNVFRLFSTRANLSPDKAKTLIMASLVLHNMLRTESAESYTPRGFIDSEVDGNIIQGDWRNTAAPNIAPLEIERRGRQNLNGEQIRHSYCEFFNGAGQVPWQWEAINK